MKKLIAVALAAVLLLPFSAFAEKPKTTLNKVSAPMTVDGDLKDWKAAGIKPLMINTKKNVAIGVPDWAGPEAQSAEAYVAFTDEAVFVAAYVKNPQGGKNKQEGGKIYDGNALELFIGFDNSDPEREMYTETDYQIGFSPGYYDSEAKAYKVKPSVYCFNMDKPVKAAKIVAKRMKGAYIIEAMVPADSLEGYDIQDGQEIGFDFGIDMTGAKGSARKVQMTWSGDKEGWQNPKGWGKAVIAEK